MKTTKNTKALFNKIIKLGVRELKKDLFQGADPFAVSLHRTADEVGHEMIKRLKC